MTEIRRIIDTEPEAEQTVELWDRMCRETPDGGPLTPRGRQNLKRMLAMQAWHRESFCLVAVDTQGQVVGFATGHVEAGDGLLPGAVGELNERYVLPEHPDADALRRRLTEAAIAELRRGGVGWVVRAKLDKDDHAERAFLESFGFEADMITMSLYDDTGRRNCEEPAP
jgi:L-amino acid N-acyltransferase YncA